MQKTIAELAELVGGEVVGDGAVVVSKVASAAGGGPDDITFAESPDALVRAMRSAVGAVVGRRDAPEGGKPVIRTDYPRLAFARIAAVLQPEDRPGPGVHPTAVVDDSASLGEDVHVGPHAVVEAGARLGPRVVVGAGSVVGGGAEIGADSRLHPRVTLYPGVRLGERVILHSGVVIGADGFGYVDTPEGKEKFPQVGTVVIEDDVEVGANTTIDRGALDATVIGAGTKIDNLCMIAHNVELGRHVVIAGLSGLSGSARVGDRAVLAGGAGMADHSALGNGAVLAARAVIATGKKLADGGVYWGNPARPIREEKRRLAAFGRLERLVAKVGDLVKRVDRLEGR
jgi:UDP-3-O-[3-hydroxymyristoyl] glucosamine N-acyltransferase